MYKFGTRIMFYFLTTLTINSS